ncbi:MAG: hypothetical protein ACYC11_06935 [Bellilinea sp.]
MKREVGLWIDHRKAVIVTIENEVEVIREIRSNLEKHVGFQRVPGRKVPMLPRVQPRRIYEIGSLGITWVIITMGSYPLFMVLKPFG